jgi:membrane protease YdiL (CAAX protease family)
MRIRSDGVVATVVAFCSLGVLFTIPGVIFATGDAGPRVVAAIVGVALVGLAIRAANAGLQLHPYEIVVNEALWSQRLSRAEVLGLAVEPILHGRFRRIVVVCADGRTIPASWTLSRPSNQIWLGRVAWAAQGFGSSQNEVDGALASRDRLQAPGLPPFATRDPGLTPKTVSAVVAGPQSRYLGWETIFIVAAFALPGIAGALQLLVKHIVTGGNLNQFHLPYKHHPGPSLVILIIGYITTALIVPIALLQLARTGQPPSLLGLTRRGSLRDVIESVGLYAGVWALNLALITPLFLLIGDSLTNSEHDTHVPAYYVVYGVILSITTAINEEVVVNGYFMTRLAQLGYSPRTSLAISLAVRTSYHVYYGLGFLATVPFGYLVTRSFQKRGRLTRPILTHFLNDVVLLVIAVLTS